MGQAHRKLPATDVSPTAPNEATPEAGAGNAAAQEAVAGEKHDENDTPTLSAAAKAGYSAQDSYAAHDAHDAHEAHEAAEKRHEFNADFDEHYQATPEAREATAAKAAHQEEYTATWKDRMNREVPVPTPESATSLKFGEIRDGEIAAEEDAALGDTLGKAGKVGSGALSAYGAYAGGQEWLEGHREGGMGSVKGADKEITGGLEATSGVAGVAEAAGVGAAAPVAAVADSGLAGYSFGKFGKAHEKDFGWSDNDAGIQKDEERAASWTNENLGGGGNAAAAAVDVAESVPEAAKATLAGVAAAPDAIADDVKAAPGAVDRGFDWLADKELALEQAVGLSKPDDQSAKPIQKPK